MIDNQEEIINISTWLGQLKDRQEEIMNSSTWFPIFDLEFTNIEPSNTTNLYSCLRIKNLKMYNNCLLIYCF